MKHPPDADGILVVDDHPIVRQGLASVLADRPGMRVVGEAASAREALDQLNRQAFRAVTVDISLEGADGLELTKQIRAAYPSLPILVVSMHDEAMYAERAIRSGADGYVMKQEVADHIVEALQTIINGQLYASDRVKERMLADWAGRDSDRPRDPLSRLSDRELEIFRLIGQGVGTRTIADQLKISVKTVETHRAHIKQKLGIETAPGLVREAVQFVTGEA